MSGKPEVSVIIPVCNKWQLTLDCLVSLKEYTPGDHYEVIVVDNASRDATVTQLETLGRALFGKRFSALRNRENLNFGPACNQGARAAAAPLLFFLNNDTLLTRDWLPPLLRAMREDSSLGAIGPLLLYMNDTVQHLGVAFFISGISHLYQHYPRRHPVVGRKRDLQAITAAAMLVPKDLFKECGGFHEEYKNGFEDIDLCFQIGQRGRKIRCVSESVIYHLESQTPGRNANERLNSKILTERCLQYLRFDAHLHALRDKFKPAIDDTMRLAFLLRDQENEALLQEARNRSFRWIHEQLGANPGWIQGADLLKDMAESYGDFDTALFYADLKGNQYIAYADLEKLQRYALMARNEEIVDYSKAMLNGLRKKLTGSPCPMESLLRQRLRRALDQGDRVLADLIEAKIAYARERAFPAPENPRYPKY